MIVPQSVEMTELRLGSCRVYEVEDHHHVLLPWAKERARLGVPLHILTLDHHTDTLPAFTHYNENHDQPHAVEGLTTEEAIPDMRHDEHFDFAVRTGLICSAAIFSHVNFSIGVNPAVTIVHDPPTEDRLEEYYAQVLETEFLRKNLLRAPLPSGVPYILDIDLDCFKGVASVQPEDPGLFLELARNAVAVTVSRERDWVRLLNLDYGRLEYPFFLERLYALLRQAGGD